MTKETPDTINKPDIPTASSGRGRMINVGIALIILSGVFWFSMIAVPFTSLTIGQKSIVAGGLFVAVQISWWTGAALAGPQVVGKIKGWFTNKSTKE